MKLSAYYQAEGNSESEPLQSHEDTAFGSETADKAEKLRTRSRSDSHVSLGGKKIGIASLVVLCFYSVSGGPFGIEDIVRAGGPFYALLGFSLFLVWAIPEALITAELSTTMPEASGSVAWVEAAFGPWWAFQKGWVSLLSGIADNSLYPILFLDCLLELLADDFESSPLNAFKGGIYRMSFIFSITVSLTYLNYRGLDVVGKVAIALCLISLTPFVLFCIFGAAKVDPNRWLVKPDGGISGVDWRLLLNTFFWNVNYWESASCFAGDVNNPGYTYPLGLGIAVGLVFLSNFVPVLVGTGASSASYTEWSDGYFVHLANTIVGPWLGYWMMFAAAIANIGMFEAEMSSDAWQIAGMADRGILPSVLGTRNAYGAPTYGVLISAMGILFLAFLSFSEVVDLLNLLYCFGQIIEFLAFLELRRAQPNMVRPFRIPLGLFGMSVVLFFPITFIVVIIFYSSWQCIVVSSSLALLGIPMHWLIETAKQKGWCEFTINMDG